MSFFSNGREDASTNESRIVPFSLDSLLDEDVNSLTADMRNLALSAEPSTTDNSTLAIQALGTTSSGQRTSGTVISSVPMPANIIQQPNLEVGKAYKMTIRPQAVPSLGAQVDTVKNQLTLLMAQVNEQHPGVVNQLEAIPLQARSDAAELLRLSVELQRLKDELP